MSNIIYAEKELLEVPTHRRFKTPYNTRPTPGEINTQPSQTVPDQSMTVSEILRRFGSGLPLGGQRVEFYEGEEDMWDGVNPQTLDISEREAIIADRANELADIQKRQKGRQKSASKQKQLDLEEEVKKQLKQQTGQKPDDQDNPEP